MSIILGIETSCDETGIALVRDGVEVLVDEVASQIDIHREFGGVVPEIASRQHTEIISHLVRRALDKSNGAVIDGIGVTSGPGLMGSLLVGVCFAKGLAYAWKKPLIPVHHIEGHLFSVFLAERRPEWPFLALVVSGGHTQLVQCHAPHRYEILGSTRDDAVGESFDKVARLLDLPYPGGPSIQRAAEAGDPAAFAFPRAMRGADTLDFSYSGLKTAVLYALRERPDAPVADVAASFQEAAVDMLIEKTLYACQRIGATRVAVVGGVAANRLLRERLAALADIDVFMPPLAYCIDNGAMIAAAADSRLAYGHVGDLTLTPSPSLPLA